MDGNRNGWQGMTIREILDDLTNINTTNDAARGKLEVRTPELTVSSVQRPTKSVIQQSNQSAAYLGPKLWDKEMTISNLGIEEEVVEEPYSEVMNMEDFLNENNIKMDMIRESPEPMETIEIPVYSPSTFLDSPESSPSPADIKPATRPSIIIAPKPDIKPATRPSIIIAPKREPNCESKNEALPKGENTFLYAESKRAKLEREKEERRRKLEAELEFAPEDLALATVPGLDFDPKERAFDLDELRPQPIIKKRKKTFVPDENKDDKYWDKREKNNIAARRSREARRLKENQIALRAAYLEKENKVLKKELDDSNFDNTKLATERDILKKKISQYETLSRR